MDNSGRASDSDPASGHVPDDDLTVVILAAGRGTRMRSELPKVLHPLAGRPMLLHVIDSARAVSHADPVVVVAPGQPDVEAAARSAGARVVIQAQPLGTADALACARTEVAGSRVLVLYGDVPLVTPEALSDLLAGCGEAPTGLISVRVTDPTGYGRILRDSDGAFERVTEDADLAPGNRHVDEINTGVSIFAAASLWDRLAAVPAASGGERYLTHLFGDGTGPVAVCPASEPADFRGINDRVQLAEAAARLRQRINRRLMLAGVSMDDPNSVQIDHGVEVAADTVIRAFTVIKGQSRVAGGCEIGPFCQLIDTEVGDGARISGSFLEGARVGAGATVGPLARIRPGTELGAGSRVGSFSEVKATTLGARSAVPHLAYIGDAEIGEDVNIGAGTITCNYDGRPGKHRTRIGDGVFIGSDSILVAPLSIGAGAYVAAGSVITSDVAEDSLAVGRSRQREIPGWAARRRRSGGQQ